MFEFTDVSAPKNLKVVLPGEDDWQGGDWVFVDLTVMNEQHLVVVVQKDGAYRYQRVDGVSKTVLEKHIEGLDPETDRLDLTPEGLTLIDWSVRSVSDESAFDPNDVPEWLKQEL